MSFGAEGSSAVFPLAANRTVARRIERQASLRLWSRMVPACLGGVFLAEWFVMHLLTALSLSWGPLVNLLDATILTVLILPGVYLTVLRPMGRLAAQLALASADARFRVVVEAASDAIIVGDRGGRILFVNGAALGMLGYSREELVGADIALLIPEEERGRRREMLLRGVAAEHARVAEGGPVEMAARRKDGDRVPVELVLGAPALREEGILVAVLRDLRRSKRIGLYESLLPVCCVCGLIRDRAASVQGQDVWRPLEEYVRRHASARFTHTYCANCLAESRRMLGLNSHGEH
ncbi:MAG: PAS domain S-box protein [Acidobacteriota bacterium]